MAAPQRHPAGARPARASASARAQAQAPRRTSPARPELRLVGRPARLRPWRRPRLVVGLAALLLTIVLFGLVAAHVSLAQGQFRLQRLERRAEAAQSRYEGLRLDVAELEAPARIVGAAQERLGMVPPQGLTYLSPTGASDGDSPPTTTARRRPTEQAAGPDVTSSWLDVKRELGRRP